MSYCHVSAQIAEHVNSENHYDDRFEYCQCGEVMVDIDGELECNDSTCEVENAKS